MSRGGVRVTGYAQTKAALARVGAQIVAAAESATDDGAEALKADMGNRVPVLTGDTKDKLAVRDGDEPGTRHVGFFDSEAIPFIEFGTSDTEAQPTVTPAAEAERAKFPDRVSAKVKVAAR